MAAITAALVKELRERTGAGMMECKKALVAVEGDIEQAIEAMRKAGQAKADKKASRTAADGIVVIKSAGNKAVMVEVNSETDFVARDDNFTGFVDHVAETILATGVTDMAALLNETVPSQNISVDEARRNLIAKIGENITVRRAVMMNQADHIGAYLHGGRIGVLVNVKGGSEAVAKDVAMHVAAANPMVLTADEVPAETVEKEKAIFLAQAKESGKPQEIAEKMVHGRLRKYLDEITLMGQAFVKEPSEKMADWLKANQAEVVEFVRYGVGEGIEKEEVDFAKEVMEQVQGA